MLRGALAVPLVALVLACTTSAPTPEPTTTANPTATAVDPTTTLGPTATPVTPAPTATDQPTATSTATDIPTPAPTVPPTDTPTETPPTVEGLAVDPTTIDRHLDAFAQIAVDNGGRRTAGTPGYDASVDYVVDELEALGLVVERQPVDFTFFEEQEPVTSLTVGSDTFGDAWVQPMLYSAGGTVSGAVETVGIRDFQPTQTAGCEPSDWEGFEAGKIALVMGGGCFSRDKVVQAQNAGAIAIISLALADSGHILQPTLIDPALIDIPALLVGSEPSSALIAAARDGGDVELSLEVTERQVTIENVIAEIPGESDEVVMLGGHLDSVLDGPGINDNGSGVASLMALAERIAAGTAPQRTVRFGFWAAEEFGLHGSLSYVNGLSDPDRQRIDAYINLDMVASPNAAHYVYETPGVPADSVTAQLTDMFVSAFEDLGSEGWPLNLGSGSDHVAFTNFGIPTGGLFSGLAPLTEAEAEAFGGQAGAPADPCYHLECDDRGNADDATAVLFANATGLVLERLIY